MIKILYYSLFSIAIVDIGILTIKNTTSSDTVKGLVVIRAILDAFLYGAV